MIFMWLYAIFVVNFTDYTDYWSVDPRKLVDLNYLQ